MKELIIILCSIIWFIIVGIIDYIEYNQKKELIEQHDSTINWYQNRYQQDSILIRDLAVMPSEGKYDQVVMIFENNNRNVKSYK